MGKRLTWKRFFASRLFFVVGVGVLLLFSVNLTRAQLKDRAIRAETEKLQAEVNALEAERQGYESLLALLDTPAFSEKEARKSLGYVKPGEQVVVIETNVKCNPPVGGANEECVEGGDAEKMTNPRKWWVYFFGAS